MIIPALKLVGAECHQRRWGNLQPKLRHKKPYGSKAGFNFDKCLAQKMIHGEEDLGIRWNEPAA